MASNDYYNSHQQSSYANAPSPSSYYPPHNNIPSPQSTPAPSYQTSYSPTSPYADENPYGRPPQSNQPGRANTQSPFDTVFDDHVYPMNSRVETGVGSNSGDISQQHGYYQDTSYPPGQHGQDTTYYGHGQQPHDTTYYGHDQPPHGHDIPLQDRPVKDTEMDDHVYDAPEGAAAGRSHSKKKKKGKVRLGELGMLGGQNKKGIPWVVYAFSVIQIAVFIGEIVRNATLTGSPIMIKPQFNPMIGPSWAVLTNMGARFSPCMHAIESMEKIAVMCPNGTKNTDVCPLQKACGFNSMKVPNPGTTEYDDNPPDQWFRFIIPIFMHAGLIHIGFNLLMQLTLGKDMERCIGSIRFFIVYISAGIFGNVMGGNYAPAFMVSTGASGALFGIIALTLLDLLYSWQDRKSPVKDLMFILIDIIVSFVLGLLPGLDNFVHIGGFLTGLAVGICVLHSPNALRKRMGEGQEPSYASVSDGTPATSPSFLKSPIGFFKGRKPLWWAWWLVRAGFLVMIIVVFIVLINNFYTNHKECGWCKYLSCIPVNNWCDVGTVKDALKGTS